MLYPVKVLNKHGALKKIISSKALLKRHWEQEGILGGATGTAAASLKKNKNKKSAYKYVPKAKTKKICEKCGNDFMGIGKRRYCGDPCSYSYHRRVGPDLIICRMCKEKFKPLRGALIFCNNPCTYSDFNQEKRRKRIKGKV